MEVRAEDGNSTLRRPEQPAPHVEGWAFSGAVWAEKPEDLALFNFKGEIVDGQG